MLDEHRCIEIQLQPQRADRPIQGVTVQSDSDVTFTDEREHPQRGLFDVYGNY
jgi:hypothetical protein